jgi:VanZ family protein
LFDFLGSVEGHRFHPGDALTNVLAYAPLGLFVARSLVRRLSPFPSVAIAILLGATLSFTMEFAQQFLPSRVASVADLITNSTGALGGALLAALLRIDAGPMSVLGRLRHRWFKSGRLGDVGLLAIALWTLSQLSPLVPSLDIGELRHGLAPLWRTLHHPEEFNWAQSSAYALGIAGLALLARRLARPVRPIGRVFAAFVACVLLYKVAVVSRQLSLEALTGAFVGLLFAAAARAARATTFTWIAAALILAGFVVDELRADASGISYRFAWTPFAAQLEHPLIGIASILENLWPATALAYLVRLGAGERHRALAAIVGALILGTLAFALEWHQQQLPGRVGDITTVLLMLGAWVAVWIVPDAGVEDSTGRRQADTDSLRRARPGWVAAWVLGTIALVGASTAVVSRHAPEMRVDESKLAKLPRPDELPPISIPRFKFEHPRLPHPTPSDLETLRRANPGYLSEVARNANGGRGDFGLAILQAYVEPGSVDMEVLLRRLVALKPAWRGHEQGKPLALAYDWLYGQWTAPQRAQLKDKLFDACDYLSEVIRNDRMSPYNVILYNSPLQALMACSIALYGDDARAEPVMRFTYDLWKNRVLPVWRQIMGKNGGWHEGGEYVGIGIGQAIYELPSMWRNATGEDPIASESGIRGFLDFLVYRTRPDGTHFRWGDGAWFDKIVPDATPLALELRNAAAYTLSPPHGIVPSGWPWGPLTDPQLADPDARSQLPPTKFFDGIGMIVARSDWSLDATYVTFKAGDNYWSHEHLDEGAFTIYKGGPLAIDSGLYGPRYGSDHHMNYSYQTIAHNAVTVTDPDDNVPAPGKEKPRPIANDGGQRRVGSGWGVEAAPLDIAEWNAKRATYHTGTMEGVVEEDGLTVGVADITPAYTNELSGQGTFAHRTRRVERFWRTVGYDRVDDVIVVFDQVRATKASFRKRWLLHTLQKPTVTDDGFRVGVDPQPRPGRAGGMLTASVLLPKDAVVTAIGGPGLEFLVDDRNYDENGTLEQTIRKAGPTNGEPGAWRIEVSPPQDEADDLFLVVLLPTLGDAAPPHRVRRLESGSRVGCEIVGPHRTTRWWYEPGRDGVEIEVVSEDGERRVHRLTGAPAPQTRHSWLDRLREWVNASR